VRYKGNDYSVPVRFGHRDVIVKGFVDEIVICIGADIIARHVRSYDRADFVMEPLHYLPLIERKLNALDQAAALADWELPVAFGMLRRLMEARHGNPGKRGYVQVLQLMGCFAQDDLHQAVKRALELNAVSFDAIKQLVMELARCEFISRRENIIALGNSGTGKTHSALALGLAACQRGHSVGFTTAAQLVHQLMEAKDEKRLIKFQSHLANYKLLIIDELGYVPLSLTGAELLFDVFSQRYERASTLVTSNLPFDEWTSIFGSERLTGALLDRLTHHVHILEFNGDSYRLKQSKAKKRGKQAESAETSSDASIIDPNTGEILAN
jgi:DNA replication protein DnaC